VNVVASGGAGLSGLGKALIMDKSMVATLLAARPAAAQAAQLAASMVSVVDGEGHFDTYA
jgi:hypothetical protein